MKTSMAAVANLALAPAALAIAPLAATLAAASAWSPTSPSASIPSAFAPSAARPNFLVLFVDDMAVFHDDDWAGKALSDELIQSVKDVSKTSR